MGEKGIGCDQAVWLEDTKGSNKNEPGLLVKPTVLVSLSFGPVESESCSVRSNSFHGILQAGILEQVAIPFSRGSSQPRDETQVSHIADRFFTS